MAVELILGEMIEKSLKQREQLEGYRRDRRLRDKKMLTEWMKYLNTEKKENDE